MNDLRVFVVSFLLLSLSCIGCAGRGIPSTMVPIQADEQEQTMVGTWEGSLGCMPALRTFSPDGTYIESLLGHSDKGTWEVTGERLTLNIRGQSSVWRLVAHDGDTAQLSGHRAVPLSDGVARWTWRRIPLTTRL